jgi:hypothetical protein
VDEFQNFSTETFSDILSEARKYHLSLVVANQFVGQLTDEIRDAVFGNVGTVISSRTGANDADFLVKYFSPTFDTEDLTKMPNRSWAVQMLMNGTPTQPFSMNSAPMMGTPNPKLAEAVKRLSSAKYGKPKAIVEKAIFERLKTIESPAPAFGRQQLPGQQRQLNVPAGAQGMPKAGPVPGSSSFLDDWLAKRKQTMATKPKPPIGVAGQKQPIQSKSPVSKPVLEPISPVTPAVSQPTKPILETHNANTINAISPTQRPVEDLVVKINRNPVGVNEQSEGVNSAISGSSLVSGEIDIDRQGLIHHSEDDEKTT